MAVVVATGITAEQEASLTRQIEAIEDQANEALQAIGRRHDLAEHFERVAAMLRTIDTQAIWDAANERERRILINEIVDKVIVHADRLQVAIHGAPLLTVTLDELGLRSGTRIDVSEGGLEPPRDFSH